MRRRMRLVVRSALVIGSVAYGCRPIESGVQPSRAAAVGAALDACNAGRVRSSAYDTVTEAGTAATRVTGASRDFRRFSLFVPDGARITSADTAARLTLVWPRCPRCTFAVTVTPDSGIGLETRIARLVAAQKRIDSANAVDSIAEFDEIDGLPQPFTTSTGRGYQIDNSCGDCANTNLLYGRPGYIASVSFGGSDDVPKLGRYLCEMTAVGKSFAWRE